MAQFCDVVNELNKRDRKIFNENPKRKKISKSKQFSREFPSKVVSEWN